MWEVDRWSWGRTAEDSGAVFLGAKQSWVARATSGVETDLKG